MPTSQPILITSCHIQLPRMNNRASSHEQLLLSQAEQARVAVESLFRTHVASDDVADIPIVFKRRRPSPGGEVTADNDAEGASNARSPKVFRVKKRHEPEGQQGYQPSEPDLTERAPLNVETLSNLELPSSPRRRRRRLHGDVKIFHPVADDIGPPTPDKRALRLALIVEARVPRAASRKFGNDPRLLKRYEQIVAKITRLEQQVQALREKEKSDAIRWIRKAMQQHGIDVRELAKGL